METTKITADIILNEMKKRVEDKTAQFNAGFWVECAQKLNLLLGDEQNNLFNLQQEVAKLKLMWFDSQEKKNVSETKLRVEATEQYKEMRKQEAKCRRIEEFIRIAKKRCDVSGGF